MLIARQIADQFRQTRREVWEKPTATTTVAMTEKLTATDEVTIRKLVQEAGYTGEAADQMAQHVINLIVGQAEALTDDLPSTSGD